MKENTEKMMEENNSPIKERSPETQLLVQYLRDAPDGALLTYNDLQKVIRQPVKPNSKGYTFIKAALRIVRNQYQKTFICQRGDGYKHYIGESEFVQLAESERHKVQRRCSEGIKRLRNARLEEFTKEGQRNLIARMTLMQLQQHEARISNVRKIENHIKQDKLLPVQRTLELLLEHENDLDS